MASKPYGKRLLYISKMENGAIKKKRRRKEIESHSTTSLPSDYGNCAKSVYRKEISVQPNDVINTLSTV